MVVVRSFAALPHCAKLLLLAEEPSVCFLWAREGATLFLAASDARFVAREDALRLHVRAGSEAKTVLKLASLALLAAWQRSEDYSCPFAVPTAVNRRATLNGPI